jgi:hypothetical protein
MESVEQREKLTLNHRLERISWGLFLIMIGGLWLVPNDWVPEGTWLIGAGLIMLGLNAARYLNGIAMSSFTIILGSLALAGGLAHLFGVALPLLPILLILIGAVIIAELVFGKEQ